MLGSPLSGAWDDLGVLTLLGYLLLAIVLVAALFFLGVTLLPAGEQLAPAVRDEPHWAVQNGRPVSAEDIENVRLPVALRGYRFAETDELLDTLADQIRWRDTELARLRAALSRLGESAQTVATPPPTPGDRADWTRPEPHADAQVAAATPGENTADQIELADAGVAEPKLASAPSLAEDDVEEAAVREHAHPGSSE